MMGSMWHTEVTVTAAGQQGLRPRIYGHIHREPGTYVRLEARLIALDIFISRCEYDILLPLAFALLQYAALFASFRRLVAVVVSRAKARMRMRKRTRVSDSRPDRIKKNNRARWSHWKNTIITRCGWEREREQERRAGECRKSKMRKGMRGGSRGWGFGASARRVRCTKHVKSLRHPRNRRPPERVWHQMRAPERKGNSEGPKPKTALPDARGCAGSSW